MNVFANSCRAALLVAVLLPSSLAADPSVPAAQTPLRALIVSGGYDVKHNQAAIESNVRYVSRLLPKTTAARVLYADGHPTSKNVLCEDDRGKEYYRRPEIARIDGPNTPAAIKAEFKALASGPAARPVLVYITGHGSPGKDSYDNNDADLWNGGHFSVQEMAGQIKTLPPATPVTLVMVQCFSGSFGNLLFENGDPKAPLITRDLCGFFAAVPSRPAAGCTAEVNEADYHDFTGYFFAALSGTSRLGQKVVGADYNHDGRVGMDEAYAYTLGHDISIDTPVCTSDVFLRRFVPVLGDDFTEASWADLQAWATPAQQAALSDLSAALHLHGEDRLMTAYAVFGKTPAGTEALPGVQTIRFVRLAKTIVLAHRLLTSTDPAAEPTRLRYRKLVAAESRSFL